MTATNSILHRVDRGLPLHDHDWQSPMGDGQWPQAAVLVALTDEDAPRVLLGRRAVHLTNHPGEIAFAGGKREAVDASPWVTAKREAMEEVGLPAEVIHPLGELDPYPIGNCILESLSSEMESFLTLKDSP